MKKVECIILGFLLGALLIGLLLGLDTARNTNKVKECVFNGSSLEYCFFHHFGVNLYSENHEHL